MVIRRVFARNLKRIRGLRGMSQEALALAAGIERTYVGLLEREKNSPTIDMVAKLAAVLEVKPEDLLKQSTKKKRS